MSPYRDYKLKTEAIKEKWKDMQENVYEEMERYCKENRFNVYIIKKIYHLTPQRLKNDPSIEIRDFAIYMLVHFSNDPLEKIATDFKDSKNLLSKSSSTFLKILSFLFMIGIRFNLYSS